MHLIDVDAGTGGKKEPFTSPKTNEAGIVIVYFEYFLLLTVKNGAHPEPVDERL